MMKINGHRVAEATVICGTLRNEDLIPAFCEEIRRLQTRTPAIVFEAEDWVSSKPESEPFGAGMTQDEIGAEIVNELIDHLDNMAPEGCYFGAHPGDGSDFGWWHADKIHED